MKRWLIAVSFLAAGMPTFAHATVDAFLDYYVPYHQLQTDDVCMMKQTMIAQLGIPPASQMLASFAPTQTFSQTAGENFTPGYENINLLATEPAMLVSYAHDSIDGATWEYGMDIDLRALSQELGSSREARRAVLRAAKLAIVTMAANLGALSANRYRLWVTFTGLPSQADLGSERKVYARTFWPYTHTSTLLKGYRTELINVEGSCPGR